MRSPTGSRPRATCLWALRAQGRTTFPASSTRSTSPTGKQLPTCSSTSWPDGRVDAVVNNVGLARFGRIGSIDLDDLFVTYDMNVRTAVQVVQAVLPGMLEAGWGRIVNVSSLTTLGVEERTPYAASKAALETSTRIWARELAQTGITVNAVAPGPVETEMYRERSPIGSERERRLLEAIPLHRLGTPREIAHAICGLLDEDAGYITGQIIRADGGGSIAA